MSGSLSAILTVGNVAWEPSFFVSVKEIKDIRNYPTRYYTFFYIIDISVIF